MGTRVQFLEEEEGESFLSTGIVTWNAQSRRIGTAYNSTFRFVCGPRHTSSRQDQEQERVSLTNGDPGGDAYIIQRTSLVKREC